MMTDYFQQESSEPTAMAVAPPQPPGGVVPVQSQPNNEPKPILPVFDWKHLALAFALGWLVGRRRPR